MEENIETLRSVSEIAITLTGFTGIVVVFGQRSGGVWNPLEWIRLRLLLETSIGVLFLAWVPILLQQLSFTPYSLWRISNGIQAFIHLTGIIILMWRIRKLDPKYWPKEEKILVFILLPVSFSIILSQIAAAAGMIYDHVFFVFLLGLYYLMLLSAIHFLLLLMPDNS